MPCEDLVRGGADGGGAATSPPFFFFTGTYQVGWTDERGLPPADAPGLCATRTRAMPRGNPLRCLNVVYFLRHFTSCDSLGECLEGDPAVLLGRSEAALEINAPSHTGELQAPLTGL